MEKHISDDFVTLHDPRSGKEYKFSIIDGCTGPSVIDIRKLYAETGYFTYDPGFTSTASCDSKITYIDGDKGDLLHRGYRIEELAEQSNYLELCYLLLHGELPTHTQYDEFEDIITNHTMLHDQMQYFFRGFRRDAHPMAIMVGAVGALSSFYHTEINIQDESQRLVSCYRLIAKMPTIAAMAYKYSVGQPFIYPENGLGYSENFLKMTFATPTKEFSVPDSVVRVMDQILILHADHEQNASTSTVRLAGSSMANPFACISAGISSLWGPAHGGANEAVLNMLHQIGHRDRVRKYIEKAKDKNDPFRLMGFGHRVYKNYDPRAGVLKASVRQVLEELDVADEPLLDLALELERIALEDDYFVERKLFPNVDFYSGIILKAMGFPTSMFTVLFALARTVGWVTQWKEMHEDPAKKIGRPRQLFLGENERPYLPIDRR